MELPFHTFLGLEISVLFVFDLPPNSNTKSETNLSSFGLSWLSTLFLSPHFIPHENISSIWVAVLGNWLHHLPLVFIIASLCEHFTKTMILNYFLAMQLSYHLLSNYCPSI